MSKRALWASCNNVFVVLVHTRREIALADFVKCVEGVVVAVYWVIVEYGKYNIAHRLRYHLEVDLFNVIFKYFHPIEEAMFKGNVSQTSRLAVNRVNFVQI